MCFERVSSDIGSVKCVLSAETVEKDRLFVMVFMEKPVVWLCVLLSAACLSFTFSIKTQTASFEPAACLEPAQ